MDAAWNGNEELNPTGDSVEGFGIVWFLIDHEGVKGSVHRVCWKGESVCFTGFREFERDIKGTVILVKLRFYFGLFAYTEVIHETVDSRHADMELTRKLRRFCPGFNGLIVGMFTHGVR